jgi:hypothetical protein
MSKQLLIGEVKEARSFIRQDVGHSQYRIVDWNVVMVPMVQGVEVEEVSYGTGGG